MLLDHWLDSHVFSLHNGHDGSPLGQEYLINDAGDVSPANGMTTNEALTHALSLLTNGQPPTPTLVGTSGGLQIDLIWDPSVANAPRGFTQAITDAAEYYTMLFSSDEVINLHVGYGEIDNSPMAPDALGESESYGYLTNYSTVTNALAQEGFSFSATNEPASSQFFVSRAEAKALDLINPTSSFADGYIGLSNLTGTGYSWNETASVSGTTSGTGSNQFDLEGVAFHEISEVMGRISMEGEMVNGQPTYTPLDLFNFQSHGVLELSGNGGSFSVNDGKSDLGIYNNAAANGGDIADWASVSSPTQSGTAGLPGGVNVSDAYDAFAFPGYNGDLSRSDIIEDAALGYGLTPSGAEVAVGPVVLGHYLADLASTIHGVQNEIQGVRNDIDNVIRTEIQGVRNDIDNVIRTEIQGARNEIQVVQNEIQGVRNDIDNLIRTEIQGAQNEAQVVQNEIQGARNDIRQRDPN